MKLFAPLSIAVALFAALVNAKGVCYDPNHHGVSNSMDAASVAADMDTIKKHGFTTVRTYISQFGPTQIGPIIASANLTAALGVPFPQSDYQMQAAAAIAAARAGGVGYIFVGNENLAGSSAVPFELLQLIRDIKAQVPSTVKVGTVQRNTEVINYSGISGWSDLVATCDLIGVNVHPYFTSGTTADKAIEVVNNQWTVMKKNFGDKLILTETGWPSDGSLSRSTGSVDGEATFFGAYEAWSSPMGESFYFQMFDTPYKTNAFEKSYGLLTFDSKDKFSFGTQGAGTVRPQRLR